MIGSRSSTKASVGRSAVIFMAFCLVLAVSSVAYPGWIDIADVRHSSTDEFCRVVLDISNEAGFEHNQIKGPDRIYIDIFGSRLDDKVARSIDVDYSLLKTIRLSQYSEDTVRVVLDLGAITDYKVYPLADPPRLVVDIYGSGSPVMSVTKRRVVIDAGHGGRDPGAIGRGGIREKDIVIDLARRVKRILEREKDYEVLFTRPDDTYLSLEERTLIANRSDADLFVSIHLNANRKRSIKGVETYLLNWTDDAEALKVAARENMISLSRMKESRSELGVILASLQLQNKRDESLKLAHLVQDSMVSSIASRYSGIDDHGVKQALFYVLLGVEMPAVLVEASFVTNGLDAKRLRTVLYRERVAHGIASGIKSYFETKKPVHQVAQR